MKRRIFLFLLWVLFLSGCGAKEDRSGQIWASALDTLKQRANYTVLENGCASRYTPEAALVEQDGKLQYFSKEGGRCYVYVHNEEPDMWIRGEVAHSDLYFFAYQQIERLNKISGFLDQGLLTYDPETQIFSGDSIPMTYVFRGKAHTPVHIELRVENGCLVQLTETYWDEENGSPVLRTDTVAFTDFSTTEVRLPLNSWDASELEEFANPLEKSTDPEPTER